MSTIGATASVMLGWCVGEVLRRDRRWRSLGLLAGASAVGLLAAEVWGMPVIKRVWTPSFVLVTGAITTLALVALHALTDVSDRRPAVWRDSGRALAWPAETLGRNALVVYLVQHLLGTALDRTNVGPRGHQVTATSRLVDAVGHGSPLLFALAWVAAMVAVTAGMRALRWYVTV